MRAMWRECGEPAQQHDSWESRFGYDSCCCPSSGNARGCCAQGQQLRPRCRGRAQCSARRTRRRGGRGARPPGHTSRGGTTHERGAAPRAGARWPLPSHLICGGRSSPPRSGPPHACIRGSHRVLYTLQRTQLKLTPARRRGMTSFGGSVRMPRTHDKHTSKARSKQTCAPAFTVTSHTTHHITPAEGSKIVPFTKCRGASEASRHR